MPEEKKIIQVKYSSKQFSQMNEEERELSALSILTKIHVICGFTIPMDKLMDVLVDQFAKKLSESYANVNEQEFEYAFRNKGIDIKDWGKALNLGLIDEVMVPYLENRFQISQIEENSKRTLLVEDKKELSDQEWQEWLEDIKKYPLDLIPVVSYDYLVRKELLAPNSKMKHECMGKAVSMYLAKITPDTPEYYEFLKMKKNGIFNGDVVDSLVVISKRLLVRDFLANP